MNQPAGKWVHDDAFSLHLSCVVDGGHCAAAWDFLANSQQDISVIDHKFVAIHHTSFMILPADVDNRIRLFQNRAVEGLRCGISAICLCFTRKDTMKFNCGILFPERQDNG